MDKWLTWGGYSVKGKTRLGRLLRMIHFVWQLRVWFRLFGLPRKTKVIRKRG